MGNRFAVRVRTSTALVSCVVRIFEEALLRLIDLHCALMKCRDIFETVHYHGGQVYLDGANMNAQVKLIHCLGLCETCGFVNSLKIFVISCCLLF